MIFIWEKKKATVAERAPQGATRILLSTEQEKTGPGGGGGDGSGFGVTSGCAEVVGSIPGRAHIGINQ